MVKHDGTVVEGGTGVLGPDARGLDRSMFTARAGWLLAGCRLHARMHARVVVVAEEVAEV